MKKPEYFEYGAGQSEPPWTSSPGIRKKMAERAEALAGGECYATTTSPDFCCTHLRPIVECLPRQSVSEPESAKEVMLHAVTRFEFEQARDRIIKLEQENELLKSYLSNYEHATRIDLEILDSTPFDKSEEP